MRSARRNLSGLSTAIGVVALTLGLVAGPAQAATYPPGGGAFNGGLEGWTMPTKAACNIPLGGLCTATAGYDGETGNPAGSLVANTSILLNLGGAFKSTATFQSPNFTASEGGAATLHVDRALSSGNLLDLAPKADYVVRLIDRTSGLTSEVLTDSLAAAGFTGKDGAATLTAGHTYAIAIDAETSSSLANVGLLGSTALRFDNVSLTVGSSGGGGGNNGGKGNGGNGAGGTGGLSDRQLLSTLQGSLAAPATLKGKRLFVKAKCPARIGHACRVTLQGLLKKRKAATSTRVVKVPKGKTKRIVLAVKPRARGKVSSSKKLLFKETVKAGGAKATLYKRLKLIKQQG